MLNHETAGSPAAWVANHGADAPQALVTRVQQVLATEASLARRPLAEALLGAGEALLAAVLAPRDGEERLAALDLLAADACVTWAFEAAADAPGTISARAEDAMRRIAAVT